MIKNRHLSLEISAIGAEMRSIKHKDRHEYLWQGDPKFWAERAPNLFPYIGRLTDGVYTVDGKTYSMDIHGFIKSTIMAVIQRSDRCIRFSCSDTPETRAMYPFSFLFSTTYTLNGKRISITYSVQNRGGRKMYFGLGGHPGFNIPLTRGHGFSDYYLEFKRFGTPIRVGMSAECFVDGKDKDYALLKGKRIALNHGIFDTDAVILKNMRKTVALKSGKDRRSVTVVYPKMDYLGLWHTPHTDAPYVCIEPWTSLPSRMGVIEDLEEQPGLVHLSPGKTYRNTWHIIIR